MKSETTVNKNMLDKDFGTDEVYALLTLRNLHDGSTTKARTNVITHSF